MGTRNLTMVIDRKGEIKVAQYGQWDGYPAGQGATILEFAKDKEKMAKLEKELENVKFWNKCDDIKNYIEEYDNKCPKWDEKTQEMLPDDRTKEDCYWFENTQTRDVCAEILYTIIDIDKSRLPKEHNGIIYLRDESNFIKDSVFCEWAYCIDLQANKLKCYLNGDNLIKEYDLDNLPTENDFVKELDKIAEE